MGIVEETQALETLHQKALEVCQLGQGKTDLDMPADRGEAKNSVELDIP